VGHTGVLSAAVKAVEHVDVCVGRIVDALQRQGGSAIITADHGNCEQMIDPATGGPHTAHTTNPVPFVLIDGDAQPDLRGGAALCDVGPTVLSLLGVEVPPEMTGADLRVASD
jgi:2,3-bisphosphoglycerate-independent phosphoglycerate mutase